MSTGPPDPRRSELELIMVITNLKPLVPGTAAR